MCGLKIKHAEYNNMILSFAYKIKFLRFSKRYIFQLERKIKGNDVVVQSSNILKRKEKDDEENNVMIKFKENINNYDIEKVIDNNKYQVDNTFCDYIIKRKKFLGFFTYDIKKYQHNILYKKSDGSLLAYLYSNKIKPLIYADRISNVLYVNCINYININKNNNVYNKNCNDNIHFNYKQSIIKEKKNLFDILYKKYSLVFLFSDISHIDEINKYFIYFNKQIKISNMDNSHNNFLYTQQIYPNSKFIKLRDKQKSIHIFYGYLSNYNFILSNYFSTNFYTNLKNTYFPNDNFFYINNKLNINDMNALLLQEGRQNLPSILLFDECCYVRYHIKGLYTNESAYYLFNILKNL
ncbi:conserved Plasmodium protein, unknown function [Plasmodium gaboni]|uniref:Thioredoxin-like protein n=1 Tax=Plasmodium gaboni TaxID=647221 RepID=A0ABY1UQZ5_9APIC|nr:conserved Plasmodium protein, unknown function [Plasmodium gaboni]